MTKSCINNKKEDAIFWICIAGISLCYLFFSVVFRYEDTISFTAWSVEFWDCVFSGRGIGSYYSYAYENVRGAIHGAPQGSWLTFFPWIIWNFPLFLTHMDPASSVISQGCIIWSKGLLLISLALILLFVYKIMLRITSGNKTAAKYAVLLVYGSLELLDSVAYTGQDEIIYLALLVMAIYFSMIGKRGVAFILVILTVTICPLMIIPAFFLLAVYDNKLIYTILKSIACLVPTVLFEAFYKNDVIYASVKDINTVGTFQLMMNTSTFPSSMGAVSIAALAMVILAFWVVFVQTDKNADKRVITTLAIAMTSMCFFMGTTFYRSCIYVPFIVMFVCMELEWISYKMLLILVCSICRFMFFLTNEYNFNTRYFIGVILKHFDDLPQRVIETTSIGYDCALYFFKVFAFATMFLVFALHTCRKKISLKNFVSEKKIIVMYSFLGLAWAIIYICLLLV